MKYIEACENQEWSLKLTNKVTLDSWYQIFKCRSWRHEGDCRLWKNAQDFVRMKNAIRKTGEEWVYIVLTFDRKDWETIWEAYKGIFACWDKLRKRFRHNWGKFEYISLVEQHQDGFPHLNLLIYNIGLWLECQEEGWKIIRQDWLEPNAVECGFGFRTWVEPVRSKEAIAGYFVKLCSEIVGTQKDQTPIEAPKHFRRLRASKGLLPKAYHNQNLVGKLIQKSIGELQESERNFSEMVKQFEEIEKCLKDVGNCLMEK